MELLVIILGGVIAYMLYKNRRGKRAAAGYMPYPPEHPSRLIQSLDDDINRFSLEIRNEIALAEKYMQASYMEWRLAREREQRIYMQSGVVLPRTPTRERQDQMFMDMERQLEARRQLFLENHRRETEAANKSADMERRTVEIIKAHLEGDLK